MATWVTHIMIVDKLFEWGLPLDEKGFCIGNIGPDCNIENEDWTSYTPSREVTHFMSREKDKSSVDAMAFLKKYVLERNIRSEEEYAFLLGYFTHLIVDMETKKFVSDEKRIRDVFARLKTNNEMKEKIKDMPETMDTLRKVFGGHNMANDIIYLERDYLKEHPESRFETILRETKSFPDYLDFFPEGAFTRKLQVISEIYDFSDLADTPKTLYFYEKEAYRRYVEETSRTIYDELKKILPTY